MTPDWKIGGLALGLVLFLTVLLVKPIGVSAQFAILDGLLWNVAGGGGSLRAEGGGYIPPAAGPATPGADHGAGAADPPARSFAFVAAMMIGGFASSALRKGVTGEERFVPDLWRANHGPGRMKRYLVAFLGGFVAIWGARLAGGCTSGHLMSGTMQTAVSGHVLAAGAFLTAVPTAYFLFPREG